MGSGRDKRKKHKPKEAGGGARKTEKKTEHNADKERRRLTRKAQGGEDDIDSLLAQFALKDKERSSVRVKACGPPSPRVFASLVPIPSPKESEAVLFGGEWYDGLRDKTHVYSDIYVLDTHKEEPAWRQVISPNGPLPRTSHQAVMHKGYMWVFGGEFTSLNQERFRHYADLWRLSLADWSWEQMPSKGGPSARSGHRMVAYKNRLILFGGFFDTGKETRYFNDAWAYDLEELRWQPLALRPGSPVPPPRGGHQLALHGDLLFVFGGYHVEKDEVDRAEGGYLPKASRRKKEEEEDEGRGITHGFDTVWCLDLKALQWERVKKQGMAPGARTSFGLVTHKKRAIIFGGIFDREGGRDKLYSESFNELYQFNLETRRWFPLALRPPKKQKADGAQHQQAQQQQQQGGDAADSGASTSTAAGGPQQQEPAALPPGVSPELHALLQRMAVDKGSALQRAATRIQSNFRGYRVRKAFQTYKLGGPVSELLYSPATYGLDLAADVIKPRARSAPMMCVLRNTLWLWGGNVEIESTDINLDDLFCLDLNKMDGWQCKQENSVGDDAFETASSEDEEDGSDASDSD